MGLNEVIALSAGANSGWSAYGAAKSKWTQQVVLMARAKNIQPVGPGYLSFLWLEPNAKRDPSNIVAGGTKLIEDALVAAGVMKNDGWADVLGLVGYWVRRPERVGVLVRHSPDGVASKETMLALLEEEINGNSSRKNGNGARNRSDAGRRQDAEEASGGNAEPSGSLGGVPTVVGRVG